MAEEYAGIKLLSEQLHFSLLCCRAARFQGVHRNSSANVGSGSHAQWHEEAHFFLHCVITEQAIAMQNHLYWGSFF